MKVGRGRQIDLARRAIIIILFALFPWQKMSGEWDIAGVVELADTLCSGRSGCTSVGVQIPPPALFFGGNNQIKSDICRDISYLKSKAK